MTKEENRTDDQNEDRNKNKNQQREVVSLKHECRMGGGQGEESTECVTKSVCVCVGGCVCLCFCVCLCV